jgi:hypothetical protein
VCTCLIDPMGIHLLHCAHGNKRMKTHDAICNTFIAIVWDVGFQVGQEQLYMLFNHIQFFLSMSWHYHYQPNMIRFISPIFCNSRSYNLQCGSS